MAERVGESELLAYVDGQLDTAGRITVEAYLRQNPEAAAQVLDDLKLRDELRLFLAQEDWPAPPRSVGLARDLSRALRRRSLGLRLKQGLWAAALVALGWFAHAEFLLIVDQVAASPAPPAFVAAAGNAHGALRLKLETGHGPEQALLPLPARSTGGDVPVPALPGELRFLGSDLVPWQGGVALVLLYDAGRGRLVSLFAAEAEGFAVEAPRAAELPGLEAVYWRQGPFAYALSGPLPPAELLALARAAARPLAGFPPSTPTPGGKHG